MATIRAQRRTLKDMREDGTLESSQYRHYYLKAKGGSYRSIAHMKTQMGVEGISIGGEQ
jgi:large subunit ribosomal protein L19e